MQCGTRMLDSSCKDSVCQKRSHVMSCPVMQVSSVPTTVRMPDAPLRTRMRRKVQSAALPSLNPPGLNLSSHKRTGMHKPPLAPKPKLVHPQRAGLSPSAPRRDGLSHASPGTPRKTKPTVAPKPCLNKLTTAVESKPADPKSLYQPSRTPQILGLLNSQNGIQQENKKTDWDYIIPICLCSLEKCLCIRNTSMEKALQKSKTEDRRKSLTSQGTLESGRGKTVSADGRADHKPLRETLTFDKDLNKNTDTGPQMILRLSIPHRTLSDEANGNITPLSAPSRALEEEQRASWSRPKSVLASPRKPVPVPRKPPNAVLARQEKVDEEQEGSAIQEGRDMDVKALKVSSEGKGSASLSVSVSVRENIQPPSLSATRACPPPAPPPRKKPYLSTPDKAPSFAPFTLPKDVEEEDLGLDSSIYEMEISVDNDDEEAEEDGRNDREEIYIDLTACSARSSFSQVETMDEDEVVKALKKPEMHVFPMEKEEGKRTPSRQDMRDLRRPPEEKRTPAVTETIKPTRSSLGKQKAKSFSGADLIRPGGQRKNSFRKLLDLKLSVQMLPKLLSKGAQTPESTASATEQHADRVHDRPHRGERKFSCPLIGVEQSVDGDEFTPATSQDYENIPLYEEIPDYMNVHLGRTAASPPPPAAFQTLMCDDEGIYEEQEPYMSLETNTEPEQRHSGYEYNRKPDEDESALLDEAPSDDDDLARTSDEEDDNSSISSKGDPDSPEESEMKTGQKKSKIHHIATEIMTSEKVFVDVLKLLHVDFREAVSKASHQSGKPVIEDRLLNQILYYLPQLYELNQDLLRELQLRVAKWDENAQLADIFLKKGPYLKMYSTYIREFDKNVALLAEQSKKNPAFAAVVRGFEASPRCANLAFKHYLLKPVQRIPQYQLLLTDYLKNLSEDSNDYKDTQAALGIVKEVANHANDIMKQGDNFQKLIQVQCSLNGHQEIVQPGRIFLKQGILKKLSRKVMQPRMFFLFNDILLYTTPVQSGQYKLNNMLSLTGMKVSKPSQEAYQNELNIESVERSFILSASSATERDEWLEAISTAISEYTKKKISFISNKTDDEVKLGDDDDGSPLGSKAPIWIPDPRTTMCMICTCEFTLTWRRHHCRACGKVVCQSCSSNKHCLEYLKNQLARVCDQCFLVLQQQKSEPALCAAVSHGNKAAFSFSRRHKKIPAALKEVSANTDNSSMSGYLQRSKGKKKQGKRLWFVIKDKVLYTYAASEDVAALESQPLLGFMLKVDSSQKLQFKLYHKNTLHYIFKADDAQTAQRWIDSFKESMVL